jgi:pimeloyl-ACP methyl ester carboxylesterase
MTRADPLPSAADRGDRRGTGRARPAEVRLIRGRIAGFAVEPLPGVGHYAQEERPDLVVEAVERMDRHTRPDVAFGRRE